MSFFPRLTLVVVADDLRLGLHAVLHPGLLLPARLGLLARRRRHGLYVHVLVGVWALDFLG